MGGPGAENDERLARVHADAYLQGPLEVRRPVAYCQGGPDGPLGVILVRDRRTEERHHGVADELLDCPSEAFELDAEPVVIGHEHGTNVFGVKGFGALGEADQIGEQHRDDLALLAECRGSLCECYPAGRAEPRLGLVRMPAGCADGHAGEE